VIEPGVGSACTLITELIVEPPDATLSVLLLGTIAVDTRGFKAKHLGTKFSSRDVAAVRKLFGWLGLQTTHEELDRAASLDEVGAAASHLRKLSLPQEARVGGAADFGKLAKVLLDARHDVSTFTTAELLRLDYKEAIAGKLRVGMASVSLCADELIRRSGGGAGLEAEMAAEAAARGGLDLLFAITPALGDGDEKGLVVCRPTPPPMGSNELLSGLEGTPRLPPRLAEQSLFVAQGISEHGLGVRWAEVPDAPSLLVTDMRGVVSRKTLLPLIIQLASESSGSAP
jgi:inorganic pyrophosphatase/exopolyphosphatase